jgi:hypothetical protein
MYAHGLFSANAAAGREISAVGCKVLQNDDHVVVDAG